MQAIDLFCGAGGASLGLKRAGFDVLGFDKWDLAVESHRANGMPAEVADLNIHDWSGTKPPALLWASPPCQPFSSAGKNAGRWDDRDGFPAYLRALKALQPLVTIMENVRGLTFKKHRPYLDAIVASIEDLGYTAEWRVLNSADFGVPQTRQRTFIVATLGPPPVWPEPTHAKDGEGGLTPWVSMATALGWVPGSAAYRLARGVGMIERHGDRPATPDTAPAPTISTKARSASWVPAGVEERQEKGASRPVSAPAPTITASMDNGNLAWVDRPTKGREWPQLPDTISLNRRQNGAPPVDVLTRPSPTITASAMASSIWQVRDTTQSPPERVPVSHSEAAILQGFPPDFVFVGGRSAKFQQIGNAVPPAFAEALARANHPLRAVDE